MGLLPVLAKILIPQIVKKVLKKSTKTSIPEIIEDVEKLVSSDKEIVQDIESIEKSFREFVIDHEGRFSELSKTMQILRSLPRPLMTLMMLAVYACVAFQVIPSPPGLLPLTFAVFTYYFGSRWLKDYLSKK